MREEIELLEHHAGLQSYLMDQLAMLRCLCRRPSPIRLSISIVPADGSSRKFMQRKSVLLPEPLRPMMQTTSRGRHVQANVAQDMEHAEPLVQPVYADQWFSAHRPFPGGSPAGSGTRTR